MKNYNMTAEQVKAELTADELEGVDDITRQVKPEISSGVKILTESIAAERIKNHRQYKLLSGYPELCVENRKLTVENRELKEALEPFAEEGERVNEVLGHLPDDFKYALGRLTFGDLRKAAALIVTTSNFKKEK